MLRMLLVLVLSITAGACDLIGDIFQAGLAVGIIAVVLVIAVIGWLIRKMTGKRH